MRFGKIGAVALLIGGIPVGGPAAPHGPEFAPVNVVTADIQAGIERHIEIECARGGGFFKFSDAGKEYRFKLVRVHTEYLANLGPRRHFACVDLVNTDGNVYDVDFFLEGDADRMTVTETTIHKLNGIPFYAWRQTPDETWEKVPVEGAPPKLLGVVHGGDEFEFVYRVELPEFREKARLWLPRPQSDRFQKVKFLSINPAFPHRVLRDRTHSNRVFFFELSPDAAGKAIELRYRVKRREKYPYRPRLRDWKKSLVPGRLLPLDGEIRAVAERETRGKKGDLVKVRALYDHVLDHMRYMRYGSGWGKGDARYACSSGTGNCTDFHSYFIALCRSAGIPARFAIGVSIPSERDDGGTDGYHCWAEFYAESKWWPVDLSEADKYSSLATYYFGHHPANRFEFSRGRDLIVNPGPLSGPIHFLADPVFEVGGRPVQARHRYYFLRRSS